MEPVRESVFEVSTTPQFFLETPLALAPPYRDWRSPASISDLSVSAPHVYFDNLQIEQPSSYDNDLDYSKILTPYSATQFRIFLERSQLLSRYPELSFKLMHGFPIGYLTPLEHTFTPPNLPGAKVYADVIRASIADELRLGRYSGPFTREELEGKIGPFRSSPLQVDVKEGTPGEPTKYRVCRHLSYKGKSRVSINDEIDSDDFPTRWGKAADVAEIVCLSILSLSLFSEVSYFILICLVTPSVDFSYTRSPLCSHSARVFSECSHSCSHSCFHSTSLSTLSIPLPFSSQHLFLFSTPTMEVICLSRVHTRDWFEGHHCWD
jgi:hypothetical protein